MELSSVGDGLLVGRLDHAAEVLPGEEVQFELTPLCACGPALALPDAWADPWRSELAAWIDERRDHLVSVSGLRPDGCVPGEPTWLRLPEVP